MARTSAGHETREKLLRAAEELFATRGVETALTRGITRLAGQSNPSAVQYHFGSRESLLDAIMAGRQERTEQALAPRLPGLGTAPPAGLPGALVGAGLPLRRGPAASPPGRHLVARPRLRPSPFARPPLRRRARTRWRFDGNPAGQVLL
ncbi:TetR family transcriptional regulator [Streptomyces sp. CB01881]|nr:hypothetical protein C2142_26980 [Streptomyces sp. CB01881]TYC71986.1 TetR family transcriptional regulator [Streptomyces sp. CB01881]